MDKTFAALIGAVGALATAGPAHAAAQSATHSMEASADAADILHAASYADLLRPIPNAVEQLRVVEAAYVAAPSASEPPELLHEVEYHHHHHHHHHHRYVWRHHHHHHHHHHHVVARVLNQLLNH